MNKSAQLRFPGLIQTEQKMAVRIRDLCKSLPKARRYREIIRHPLQTDWIAILRDVNLDVLSGEVLGLIGPNGAGKTTLLRIVCGLLLPTDGIVQVLGFDVVEEDHEVRRRVGYVPADERSFLGRLSAFDNMEFYARLQGLRGRSLRQSIMHALEQVGLEKHADMPFMSYSSGMKQKLAIARGLLGESELILLDEPTRSLDACSAVGVRSLIKRISASGKTVIVTSHNLQEIETLCERIAIIHAGRIAVTGTAGQIRELARSRDMHHYELAVRGDLVEIERVAKSAGVRLAVADHKETQPLTHMEVISESEEKVRQFLHILLHAGVYVGSWTQKELTLEEAFLGITNDADPSSR